MVIGLNLLYLIPGCVGGVQTYAEGLLRGLAEAGAQHEYLVCVNREAAEFPLPLGANFRRMVAPISGLKRTVRYAFEQAVLPYFARREGIDVLHSLGYVSPLSAPCATVVTLHDLNFIRLNSDMSPIRRFGLSFFARQSAQRANRVITVSEFARKEICAELALPPERVSAVHHGPPGGGCAFVPRNGKPPASIAGPFVLAFGGGAPHKNIRRLIRAFEVASSGLPYRMVVAGHLHESVAGCLTDRVVATGYLRADALQDILRRAKLFVLPSLYEGFGFPVIEAQRAGIPVACSNAAALPEIAGDGAVYFPPESEDEMACAIRSCLCDPALRSTLVSAGHRNAQRFSWRKTAAETLRTYEEAFEDWRHARSAQRRHMRVTGMS